MYEVKKGKPFYFALKTMIYSCDIPKNLEKSYLKYFWLKYSVVKGLVILVMIIEPILHVIISIKNDTGIDLSEDFAVMIGCIGAETVCFLFTKQIKQWTDLFNDLTFFEDAVDISIFENRMKYFNFVTRGFYGYTVVGLTLYGILNFTQTAACEQLNKEKNLHELCGTLCPIWLPFRITSLTSIILISLTQFFSCLIFIPIGALISCIIWEATEILIIHMDILKGCFINLFEGPGELSDKLRFCVNYHIRILSLGSRFNMLVKRTASHMTFMAALIFAVILNQMTRTTAAAGPAIYLIGYISSMFFFCHSGEILKNGTLSISNAVWASNWYKADAKTMKVLAFVMLRVQKPLYFEAIPLGTVDYALFLIILKTSYSYLTLLNQSV